MNRMSFFAVLLAGGAAACAHPPDSNGVHSDIDPATLRLWTNVKTGETVRGGFLAARGVDGVMRVSIERENGDVVAFPLEDLMEADRAEARKKIAEVRALHERIAFAAAMPGGGNEGVEQGAGAGKPEQAAPFEFFAPAVKTRWDDRWLYVESDGLPHAPWNYAPMVGITSWQQQVPLPQAYTGENAWRIPLKPELAEKPISGKTHLYRGAIALAANGVPIFNALNNRGDDAFKAGELDEYGGHSGRGDDYHYHIAPLAIEKIVGKDKPIAYALDGFPIYGLFEPGAKPGEEKACPLGGVEKLDELNGHFGAGPSGTSGRGLYHYHASLEYPYINGGMRGKVTVSDDQVDPQPRANVVRPWLQPLRGAAITGLKAVGEKSWSLEYTLGGTKHLVNYRIEGAGADAKYIFEFVDPEGSKKVETYDARPQRGGKDRPPPRDGPRGRDGRGEERTGRGGDDARDPAPAGAAGGGAHVPGTFWVESGDVKAGKLAVECTCDAAGASRAPALRWGEAPKNVKAYAVVMHHVPPDGGEHVYMVVANIPASASGFEGGDAKGGTWGQNTVNRRNEYAPPCSKGPGDKVYVITVYALSAEAPVSGPLTKDSLLQSIKGTTLGTATLEVTYARAGGGKEKR